MFRGVCSTSCQEWVLKGQPSPAVVRPPEPLHDGVSVPDHLQALRFKQTRTPDCFQQIFMSKENRTGRGVM